MMFKGCDRVEKHTAEHCNCQPKSTRENTVEKTPEQRYKELGAVSFLTADVHLSTDLQLLADVRSTDCFP